VIENTHTNYARSVARNYLGLQAKVDMKIYSYGVRLVKKKLKLLKEPVSRNLRIAGSFVFDRGRVKE